MSSKPLNVIILCTDEMRGDCLAANGRNPDIRTPHMDALAARGVNFSRHFTTFPKCTPARISLMTGRYCHTDGYRTISQHLPHGTPDLLSVLRARGYQAALFGKNHCWEHLLEATHDPPELAPGQSGLAADCHSWTPPFRARYHQRRAEAQAAPKPPGGPTCLEDGLGFVSNHMLHWADEVYAEQAIEYLTRVRDRSRPFFLQVNIEAPHPKYAVEEPYFSMYDRDAIQPWPAGLPRNAPLPLAKQREIRTAPESTLRAIQTTYMGMVTKVDALMGRIVAAIEAERLFEDSIVLLWSDHGDFAGQYGLPEKWDTVFSDCLLHVPFALVAPGLPRGTTVEALTDHTDIAPTLCEVLGIPPLPGMHGRSLLPVLGGAPSRDAVFADGGHEDDMLRRFSFYDGRDRPEPTESGLPTVGGGKQETYRLHPDTMARAKMVRTARHKMVVRLRGGNELYDLSADPWEMDNRWGAPAVADVTRDLQQKLLEWCLETDTDRPYQKDVGA
jgi:choline-sulfatase